MKRGIFAKALLKVRRVEPKKKKGTNPLKRPQDEVEEEINSVCTVVRLKKFLHLYSVRKLFVLPCQILPLESG